MEDIVQLLLKRAEIRRQITSRKSVQENKPDRISDLLEAAASEILKLRVELETVQNESTLDQIEYNAWYPIDKEFWDGILERCRGAEAVESGSGTHCSHCWDVTYKVGTKYYNILYQINLNYPIEITAKDIE